MLVCHDPCAESRRIAGGPAIDGLAKCCGLELGFVWHRQCQGLTGVVDQKDRKTRFSQKHDGTYKIRIRAFEVYVVMNEGVGLMSLFCSRTFTTWQLLSVPSATVRMTRREVLEATQKTWLTLSTEVTGEAVDQKGMKSTALLLG